MIAAVELRGAPAPLRGLVGLPVEDATAALDGLRLLLAAALSVVAVAALLHGLLVALPLPAAALLPGALLRRSVRRARGIAARDLPAALDVIASLRAAGAGSARAVALAAGCCRPPLRSLLGRVAARVELGGALSTTLLRAARDGGLPELESVAAIIERGERLGVPTTATLRAFAAELRSREAAALQERAGRAGPVAALVTSVVIAPSCVVLLGLVVLGGAAVHGRGTGLF